MLKSRHALLALASAALHFAVCASAAHAFGEAIAAPHGAQVTEVAPALRINGVPTQLRSFHVELPLAAVEQHFRAALGAAVVREQLGQWTVLARVQQQRLDTIRLRAAGPHATEGTLSAAELGAAGRPSRHGELPPPPGSERQLDLHTHEHGRSTRFIVWHGARSIDAGARHLQRTLGARGLQLERSLPLEDAGARGRSLWFRGRNSEATAVIVAERRGSVSVSLALSTAPDAQQ